jgi:hypothetical protein
MKPHRITLHTLHTLLPALAAVLALAGAGCSSKSPSEPSGGGGRSPIPPPPVTGFSVVVTANPGQLTTGTTTGSTITVRVVNTSTGRPPADATPVTLTTTLGNFGSATGPQQITLQLVGGQAAAVLFPGTSEGTATVTAQFACPADSTPCTGTSGAASVRIGSAGTFFVSSVTPNVGNATGGDQVTINGGGFVAPVRVTFNGTPGQVVSVSSNAIRVITPSATAAGVTVGVGQTASVAVGVTINVNQPNASSDTLANGFTYSVGGQPPSQPQVFSVNPASGPDQGGTRVTILGQGFQAPVQVFFGSGTASAFNGVEATVQSVTATQLVVLTPSATSFGQNNVDKVVDLLVKNVNSGFSTLAPQAFKYGSSVLITSIAPDTTDWNKPVRVTVFGQGFQDPVAVDLAGVAAQVLQTSGTEIQVLSGIPALTSCNGIALPSHEVNINTGQGATGPMFHYLITLPAISSITPSSGPQGGGTVVTIRGREFDFPNVSVTFGTATVFPGAGSSSTQLIVTAPQFTGTFPTQPCTGAGGVTGTMNVPAAVDVKVTNTDTTCSVTATQAFTYIPSDQTCHVTPPPPPVASFTVSQAHGSFTVIFNNTSTGTITSYLWDFGDTTTSAAQNPPPHTYTTAGTKVVTLTVTGPGGTSSASQFVTVPGP